MNMQDRQNIKKEYCLSVPAHDRDLAVAAFRAWLAFETRPRHWNVPAVLAWLGFNVVPFSPDNTDNTDPAAIRSTFDGQTDVQQTRNEAERREDSLSLSPLPKLLSSTIPPLLFSCVVPLSVHQQHSIHTRLGMPTGYEP